jgi:tRNA-dihydrouridine synthase B
MQHLDALYVFYGEAMGVRIARKHVGWYLQQHSQVAQFKTTFNRLESAQQQRQAINTLFEYTLNPEDKAA